MENFLEQVRGRQGDNAAVPQAWEEEGEDQARA